MTLLFDPITRSIPEVLLRRLQHSSQPLPLLWPWLRATGLAWLGWLVLLVPLARADEEPPRTQTESPYFFVKDASPGVDALPLKSTQVRARIAGVMADVTVTQRYKNEGQRPLEASYLFPGSTRAAVHGMQVRLGQRVITAQIREKQQARLEYDKAKSEGKTAALLEQHRPNVFQMNVANILPGDEVEVELHYTELLVPTAGQYQFVFPTVVGPRYAGRSSAADAPPPAGSRPWTAQPYLSAGQPNPTPLDIEVALHTPVPLKAVNSPSHRIQQLSRDGATLVRLESGRSAAANNRDFILDYQLAGEQIESGVLLYKGPTENFFVALVEPPKAVSTSAITPREYIFVVDISGSMHGFPLDTAKTLLAELIGQLRPSDHFNVLLFSGSNRFLSPHAVPATHANIDQALRTIDQMGGGGSTELIPALQRVYAEPKPADVSRTVVVVTDGYVSVEREAFALVRQHLNQANLFAFGIGSSVNRHLMEGLARAGMGEPFIITQPSEAAAQAKRFKAMIQAPVLTQVRARFNGVQVYDVEPEQLPDVLGQRPVVVFGKWRGNPAQGEVVIEGHSASGPYRQTLPLQGQVQTDTEALRWLWARHRITSLSDQEGLEGGDSLRQRITDLGLSYSLLTQYTSFIAVDQQVRNPDPQGSAQVQQPLPLPQGVSHLAVAGPTVGAEVPSAPEPASWGAVLVLLSVLALLARRARRHRADRWTA